MTFLFEEYAYDKTTLDALLGKSPAVLKCCAPLKDPSKEKLQAVGYFYNSTPKEEYKYSDASRSIFILPKVFLKGNGESVFNKTPDAFLPSVQSLTLADTENQFLSTLGLYLWSAIAKYHDKLADDDEGLSSIIAPPRAKTQQYHHGKCEANLINVTLSMREFYKENRQLFVFIAKNKHSGIRKVDWQKTISRKSPVLQDDIPIYMELVGKRKVFDLDDALIVLYFSAMDYINRKFGIDMPKSEFYEPMPVREIERLLENGRGLRLLQRIKYKYFADKFLKLYNIMLGFFKWGGKFRGNGTESDEYLLAKDFNLVFEAMIDALISDDDTQIQEMKNLKDGKIIDHLYKEKPLIFAGDSQAKIWYIGDSKYYKDENEVTGASVAKQYTYAKNIIQDFFSPGYFKNHVPQEIHQNIRYRDSLTEGYNVTPNFFIRGVIMDKDGKFNRTNAFSNDHAELCIDKEVSETLWEQRNRHFENRLFDRDTLLLQTYDVNFLHVLYAYTAKNDSVRNEFRSTARAEFRKNFLKLLDEHYVFWALYPKNLKDFVRNNFQLLLGKIFTNSEETSSHIIFALERETSTDEYNEIWGNIYAKINEAVIITPQELFGDSGDTKEDADFKDAVEYDADQNGFWINADAFLQEIISNGKKIPQKICGQTLRGNFIPEYKQADTAADQPRRFLLPCVPTGNGE